MSDSAMSPDRITVSVSRSEEVEAEGAELRVAIQGSAVFAGNVALTRVREVLQCVAELKNVGIGDDDIQLESVEASKGITGSSATYVLRVVCRKRDGLGDILGILTAQKHIQVRQVRWTYPDLQSLHDFLLDACISESNRQAGRIAMGLGVRLVGVHSFRSQIQDNETAAAPQWDADESFGLQRAKSRAPEWSDFGSTISHTKLYGVTTLIEFRIEGFDG